MSRQGAVDVVVVAWVFFFFGEILPVKLIMNMVTYYSFIFSKSFLLVRVAVYPEPVVTMGQTGRIHPRWDASPLVAYLSFSTFPYLILA